MRIEGTYGFPAPVSRVASALTDPAVLQRAIPGCERLIQLGPTHPSGTVTFELRLRAGPGAAVYATQAALVVRPQDGQIRLEVRGYGPQSMVSARGTMNVAGDSAHTSVSYVWEIKPQGLREDQQAALSNGAGQRLIQSFYGTLAQVLRASRYAAPDRDSRQVARAPRVRAWARRVAGASAAKAVGLALVALFLRLARRFGAHRA